MPLWFGFLMPLNLHNIFLSSFLFPHLVFNFWHPEPSSPSPPPHMLPKFGYSYLTLSDTYSPWVRLSTSFSHTLWSNWFPFLLSSGCLLRSHSWSPAQGTPASSCCSCQAPPHCIQCTTKYSGFHLWDLSPSLSSLPCYCYIPHSLSPGPCHILLTDLIPLSILTPLQKFKLDLEKAEEPEIKLPMSKKQESSREV